MTKFWVMMVLAFGLTVGCGDDTTCTVCSCNPALCDGGDSDTNGDSDSDSSTCDSDDPVPVVAFIQPTDGAEVSGVQTVEISVTDRCGINELTLDVDGAPSATWTAEPYTWVWDTSGMVSGNHTLTANATDVVGQTASATIEVEVLAECFTPTDCPPRVRIVYPTAGSRVCGTLNVEATATGEDDVTQVEFQINDVTLGTDTTAPYQAVWNTTTLADGNYSLTATARDASGQEAWHTVSVIVENAGETCDNLPTTVIVEPAGGSYVHGDVIVRVNASDDIGVIRVRVFMDAGMIWEDTTAPFEGVWHTGDFAEGPHLLRAEATDTAGQQSSEASIEVDVDRTPPTVAITSPYDGEAVSGTRVVTASATDNLSVASVTFTATDSLTRSFTDTEAPFEWSLDFPPNECDADVAIEAEAADRAGWTATDTITVVLATTDETCNGLDDDCDGSTDEDFDCRRGSSRTCIMSCLSTGAQYCSASCSWDATCIPPSESCDGIDNNCDTVVDDGFECQIGDIESCTTPFGEPGHRRCGTGCTWDTCSDACVEEIFSIERAVPDMLIVLDRSNSMSDDGYWNPVREAIYGVTETTDTEVWFGLMIFPNIVDSPICSGFNYQCEPGHRPLVNVTAVSHTAIRSQLSTMLTCGGTPTADTLYNAHTYLSTLAGDGHLKYLLLATDGPPNCNNALPGGTCTCTNPMGGCILNPSNCLDDVRTISIIEDMRAADIQVFVMGIGTSTWMGTLNAMAAAGGTGGAFLAEDTAAIRTTFEDIVGSVMTCEFDLHLPSPSVDPTLVNFYFDGIDVPGNSTDGVCYNGWGWLNPEHTRIRFCGSYCNSIMSHTVTEITATWGCPTITP